MTIIDAKEEKNKSLFAIFKPTLTCNLKCKYCYAIDETSLSTTMTKDEMIKAISWLADYCKEKKYSKITLLWHGGEPLIINPNILREVLEEGQNIFHSNKIICEYRLQSNLISINRDIINIIKNYFDSHIGGSLDYNIGARCYPNGKDSTDTVLKNIEFLRNEGIKVGIITMLTPQNTKSIDTLYEFLKSLHIPIQLSRIFTSPANNDFQNYLLSEEEYANAVIRLFDIWINDNDAAKITSLIELSYSLLRNKTHSCELSGLCQKNYISISNDGSIYPCGRYGFGDGYLGNIFQMTPDEFIKLKCREDKLKSQIISKKCTCCGYFSICHGGCTYESRDRREESDCARKLIYQHIETKLKERGYYRNKFEKLTTPISYLDSMARHHDIQ